MGDTIRVAVLGASGFAGGELIRLLEDHPGVDVTFLGAKGSAGIPLGQAHPHLRASSVGHQILEPIDAASIAETADLAFCCLPHGQSARRGAIAVGQRGPGGRPGGRLPPSGVRLP